MTSIGHGPAFVTTSIYVTSSMPQTVLRVPLLGALMNSDSDELAKVREKSGVVMSVVAQPSMLRVEAQLVIISTGLTVTMT